jgi:type I protein arginine methyltransferase
MNESRSALTQYNDFYGMLSDDVRMNAFRRAIEQKVKPGDVVVDLGAGTGILGFLALQAGAELVYVIEKRDSIELAKAVAEQNGMAHKMVFLNENSRDVSLPDKADVLVSETLGSFGIDENTLEFTVDARERFLKPGGVMIPQGLTLYLAPVQAAEVRKKIDFWRNIQGIDFSPAREVFGKKIMVETVEPGELLSEPAVFDTIDLRRESKSGCTGKLLFEFTRPGAVHGIAGWFDLDLTDEIRLSTAPDQAPTHWQQALFPILESVEVIQGDFLELTLSVIPQAEQSDNTTISYQYRCSQRAKDTATPSGSVGRNDPCPCGSGRKHKKCCGQ